MKTIYIVAASSILAFTLCGGCALADSPTICSSSKDQLECLKNNDQALHTSDRARYWKILHEARSNADACTSQDAVVDFLGLATHKPRGAEFEEFFAESIELLLVRKRDCFLTAMNSSSKEVRRALIEQLHHPLTIDEESVVQIFHSAHSVPEYRKVAAEFLQYRDSRPKE